MPNYTFEETVNYVGEKIHSFPPKEDIQVGVSELMVEDNPIIFSKGALEGSIKITTTLGLFTKPLREGQLKELVTGNFLGVKTGGYTLSCNRAMTTLFLLSNTSPGTSPQENWDNFHRFVSVANELSRTLTQWNEWIPLFTLKKGAK